MTHYLVSLNVVREKIFIIKLIRAITTWVLKDSKDFAEANFTFDSYMTPRAEFDITVDAAQLGQLLHFSLREHNYDRCIIDATREVTPTVNVFDFTNA